MKTPPDFGAMIREMAKAKGVETYDFTLGNGRKISVAKYHDRKKFSLIIEEPKGWRIVADFTSQKAAQLFIETLGAK